MRILVVSILLLAGSMYAQVLPEVPVGGIPSGTTAQINAIPSPIEGLMAYSTDDNTIYYYNGTAWVTFLNTNIYNTDGTLTGSRTVTMGTNPLSFDSDSDSRSTLRLRRTDNNNQVGMAFRNSGGNYTSTMVMGASSNGNADGLSFYTGGSQANVDNLSKTLALQNNNQLEFTQYGSGTFLNNSPARYLGVEADGDVVEIEPSALGTDNQTIDVFNFDSATNVLSLSLERDGVATETVDLSGVQDDDWYEVGTTTAPNAITDNIFTQGNVGIGVDNPQRPLHIAGNNSVLRISRSGNTAGLLFDRYDGTVGNTLKSFQFGLDASSSGVGEFFLADYNENVSGAGFTKIMSFTDASAPIKFDQYGSANTYQFDNNSPDRILGLEADGDVISVDPSGFINSDNQTVDLFSFNGTNNVLSLSLEDDGEAALTVDLSGLNENIYNTNGTLTGNRQVTMDAFNLQFNSATTSDTNGTINIRRTNNANSLGIAFRNSGNAYDAAITMPGSTNSGLQFRTLGNEGDVQSVGIAMQLDEDGQMVLPEYGETPINFEGTATAAKVLGVEADGDVVELNTAKSSRIFYPPSIAIDASVVSSNTSAPGDETVDLYQQYIDQYTLANAATSASSTGAPSTIPTYAANELYYYVTYYDPLVFANVTIDANGMMSYDIINTPSGFNTLINVVFVVR